MSNTLKETVSQLIRPEIQALHAYHVPDASGYLKLDAMENPFQWSDDIKQEWAQELTKADINRYPDPQAQCIKDGLRSTFNINDKYDILLGNGSDEIIQILAMAVAQNGRCIMAPEPSFVMYKMIATFCQLDYVGMPLNSDFELDLDAMLTSIKTNNPALIFLAQPNNPTGNLFGEKSIRAIIEAADGLVVVDEAYTAFTNADYLSLLDDYDNVVIMRTLSKVGLAGLRMGFLVGKPEWLGEFDKIRLPYNINCLTQISCAFALKHFDLLKNQTEQLRKNRTRFTEQLNNLAFDRVFESQANFVLVRTQENQAKKIFTELKEMKILIKCLDGGHPLLTDCLRLTVGTESENDQLIEALASLLEGSV
jgi:histidinol-phosphate aminotransferase